MEYKEFVLPEKWCIEITRGDVVDYCNKYGERPPYNDQYGLIAHFPCFSPRCTSARNVKNGYTLITLKEFEKYVLKAKEMNNEIIGYKCPIDLFGGDIKKGHIYTKSGSGYGYYPLRNLRDMYYLPKEIVETWEKVYEKDMSQEIIIGNRNTKVNVKADGTIEVRGEKTTINLVKALHDDFFSIEGRVIGTNWKTFIDGNSRFIQIGCSSEKNLFSLNDLRDIINTHNNLKANKTSNYLKNE